MKPKPKIVVLEQKQTRSKAYWSLKVHVVRALIRFMEKRQLKERRDSKGNSQWIIMNNGEIIFTYKEAEKLGINRAQFRNAIDDLIAKGFLEITHHGTGTGDPSTFWLCERWQAYGTENFKPANPRRKNTADNRGWALYNTNNKHKSSDENTTSPSVKNDTSSRKRKRIRVLKETLAEAGHYADNG